MTLSELQAFRVKRGISLTALAASTGLPESYLAQIEDKKIKASEEELKRIDKALRQLDAAGDDDAEEY